MADTEFSVWLSNEMKLKEFNQKDLSRFSGISQPVISRVLRNQRPPGIRFCKGIAKAFGIPVSFVMNKTNVLSENLAVAEVATDLILLEIAQKIAYLPEVKQKLLLDCVDSIYLKELKERKKKNLPS